LAAGASVTIGTQGGAVALASGSHTIQAVVDDINRFAESNESNNSFIQSITRGGPALPDVVVTSISYSGGLFQCTVRNQGTAATPAGVAVGAAYFVDGVYRTWGSTMGPLAAGAAVVLGTQGGSYVIPAGTHSVRALADDVNRFAESNESNNDLSQSFTIATGAALKTAPVAEDPELVIAPDPEAAPSAGGGGGACGLLGLEALIVLYFAARLRPLRGLREGFVPFF
ncbi:MAG: hypothetical protein HY293_19845, partial [Planctomycetes bacterium]|nr:hypothetical protein [Planctomycetota bacterium]